MPLGRSWTALALPFPDLLGDPLGVDALERDGEGTGMRSSSELSTPQRVRRVEYDSRVEYSSSSSCVVLGKSPFERVEAGMATRNERDVPAYVRVFIVIWGAAGRGDGGIEEVECLGGDEGKFGREGVRRLVVELLDCVSREDSVFERASMRLASFVGDEEGDEEGVMESNIRVKSRASLGERDSAGGDGNFGSRFGEPYVLDTVRTGVGGRRSSTGGVETISTESFCRFLG